MTQHINQFSQSAERGQVALLNADSFTLSAVIDSTETSTLNAGDAVKLVANSNKIPHVVKATDETDKIFGFIIFNPVKNAGLVAGDRVEVAITGEFIYLIASGAINAGDEVMIAGDNVAAFSDAVKAYGTLTASGAISANEAVTLGSTTYTFKSTVSSANDVALGATTEGSLNNLVKAINASGVAGTDYGTGTTANASVSAELTSSTTVKVTALAAGTAGNSIASTETGENLAFGAATLANGAATGNGSVACGKALDAASNGNLLRVYVKSL